MRWRWIHGASSTARVVRITATVGLMAVVALSSAVSHLPRRFFSAAHQASVPQDESQTATVSLPARRRRVVVSLTTHPARFRHINPTLRALSQQTFAPDTIYIHPSIYMEGTIDTRGCDRCIVTVGENLGPATKLIRTLRAEHERGSPNDTVIIIADDDWRYPTDVVETLVREANHHPDTVVALSGYKLVSNFISHKVSRRADLGGCPVPTSQRGPYGFRKAGGYFHRTGSTAEELELMKTHLMFMYNDGACGQEVDVVQGAFGILLELGWLDFCWMEAVARTFVTKTPFMFGADDIFISGVIAKAQRPKRIFGRIGRYTDSHHLPQGSQPSSLRWRMDDRYRQAVPFMQRQLGIWQEYNFERTTDLSKLPHVVWPTWPKNTSHAWSVSTVSGKRVARCLELGTNR
eukprot:m.79304 g.79304  ORF g.79304 m.79304 type:complete len:406 (-) comp10794_c0_seq2:166-1383(-)